MDPSGKGSLDTLAVDFLSTHALITIPVDVLGLVDRRQIQKVGRIPQLRGDAQSPPGDIVADG